MTLSKIVQLSMLRNAMLFSESLRTLTAVAQMAKISLCPNSSQRSLEEMDYLETVKAAAQRPANVSVVDNFQKRLSDDQLKKHRANELEYDLAKSAGECVPEKMTNSRWFDLLNECKDFVQRKRLLEMWALKDLRYNEVALKNIYHATKRIKERRSNGKKINEINKYHAFITNSSIRTSYLHNMSYACQFEPTTIFDMSFEYLMHRRDLSFLRCTWVHGLNAIIKSKTPYNIQFTGLDLNCSLFAALMKQAFPDWANLVTVSKAHYLSLFPRKQLAYLSPHGRKVLKRYDPNVCYIIGMLTNFTAPLTGAKARQEDISSYRLPVEKYLKWHPSSNSLRIDQVMIVLNNFKNTGNWKKSFEFIKKDDDYLTMTDPNHERKFPRVIVSP